MLLHIPIIGIYNSYTYYKAQDLATFSLGNMGFSETKCLIEGVAKITS